jgi:hypothetical protein
VRPILPENSTLNRADFSSSSPPAPQGFINVRNVLNAMPPNAGPTYLVGASRFIEMLVKTFVKVYPNLAHYMVIAPSDEHALEMIRERKSA